MLLTHNASQEFKRFLKTHAQEAGSSDCREGERRDRKVKTAWTLVIGPKKLTKIALDVAGTSRQLSEDLIES